MPDLVDHLLVEARQAFGATRHEPIDAASHAGSDLDVHLRTYSYTRLPDHDVLLLRRCSRDRDRGLAAAREHKLASATQALQESARVLSSQALSPEARLLGTSFQLAVEAYIEHRRGHVDSAVALLQTAIDIDERLIRDCGYSMLVMHRVQLLHNLMRVRRTTGDVGGARVLGCALLDYLEGRSVAGLPGTWRTSDLDHVPNQLIEKMYVQIVTELAALLFDSGSAEAAEMTAWLSHHLQHADARCAVSPACHRWMRAHVALASRDLARCLGCFSDLLTSSRAEAPTIWCVAALDLAAACRLVGSPESDRLRSEIVADTSTWNWLPPVWRRTVDKWSMNAATPGCRPARPSDDRHLARSQGLGRR